MFRALERTSIRVKVLVPVIVSVAVTAVVTGVGVTALGGSSAARHAAGTAQAVMLVVGSVGLLVVLGMVLGLTRRCVLGPLEELRQAVKQASGGRIGADRRVKVAFHDEIGELAESFNAMLDFLAEREEELASTQAEREAGLQERVEVQHKSLDALRKRAQAAIDSAAATVTGELEGVRHQVGAVRTAAGTIDDQVGAVDSLTRQVVGQANHVDQALASLTDSLREVTSMTQLIASVSEQTKLLALNATIEAARAGAAGQGFTVVANEVKALAETTARSTERISSTIGSLEDRARTMGEAIGSMTESISGVDQSTAALAQVAADQSALVSQLDRALAETIDRLSNLSSLTEKLERRGSERHGVSGRARIRVDGQTHDLVGEMLDISEGGVAINLASGHVPQYGLVQLELTFGGRTFAERASVQGSRGQPGELGFLFLDPSDGLLAAVRALAGAKPAAASAGLALAG